MPIRDDFLRMLRCPLTRKPLELAEGSLLARLNELVGQGGLKNRAGDLVEEPLEAGLIEPDEGWLYPVWGNIPSLLPDEAISTTPFMQSSAEELK